MVTQRKLVILLDGHSQSSSAKTGISVIRYKPEEVVAVLDHTVAGRACQEILGVGGDIPIVASLAEAPEANTLLIGIAPSGGKIPSQWRPLIIEAISRKMNIVSGLHDFLADDPEFALAAKEHGAELIDVRKNDEHDVAQRKGVRQECLRIHTVAHDCSCGKMLAAIEVARELERQGVDAKFVATGQTGIMIEGDGCPIDRVITDFVSGATEKLVLNNQHHDIILVEGQGSLYHPRYSGVTFGLLHGIIPDGLIFCYEMGRESIGGMPEFSFPPLKQMIDFYEAAANIMHPCKVIGIAVNGRRYSEKEVLTECERVQQELALPACDVIRHGPAPLVEAVLTLAKKLDKPFLSKLDATP